MISTKFALRSIILLMPELEKKIKENKMQAIFMVEVDRRHIFLLKTWERQKEIFLLMISIKLTAEWLNSAINFLDIAVSIKNGVTGTDTYIKPTGSYQYLLYSSYHLFQYIKDILYSQVLQANNICSKNNFDENCNNFKKYLFFGN